MTQITFDEYVKLQTELKQAKDELWKARQSLQEAISLLKNREDLIFENRRILELYVRDLRKQNKYLKRRLSKYEYYEEKETQNRNI